MAGDPSVLQFPDKPPLGIRIMTCRKIAREI